MALDGMGHQGLLRNTVREWMRPASVGPEFRIGAKKNRGEVRWA